jgi:hypothetical protein
LTIFCASWLIWERPSCTMVVTPNIASTVGAAMHWAPARWPIWFPSHYLVQMVKVN